MRSLIPRSIRYYVPLLVVQFYLSITVVLFFFGPWPWPYENGQKLFAYLASSQVIIFIGYFFGISMAHRSRSFVYALGSSRFYNMAIIFSFILLVPTTISRTGNIFPFFLTGIDEIGVAYNIALLAKEGIGLWVFSEYLRIIFSVFLVALFPLTVFYWPTLTIRQKFFSLFVLIWFWLIYVSTGTNKFFADILISIPFLLLLQNYAFSNSKKFISYTKFFLFFLLVIFLEFAS